jgi:hypothetical protein
MRDADEWAASLDGAEYVDDDSGWQVGKIAALIREAQLEGIRYAIDAIENAREGYVPAALSFDDVIGRTLGEDDD